MSNRNHGDSSAPHLPAGHRLGHLLIKSPLGRGGMGTLYSAVDTILHREIAVKLMDPDLTGDATLLERFKKEAVTQAQLQHPNIITIYGFSPLDNRWVLSMEYITGQSMSHRLKEEGPFAFHNAIDLARQILRGLSHAHGKHIIHGDIKPANILLTESDMVKITDFGIARVQGERLPEQPYGTPGYSPPEQILGRETDARSDIYSFGLTFYEMLTGLQPFNAVSDNDHEIESAHFHHLPVTPSKMVPEIDPAIDGIVMRAIAKRPDERFQNAQDLLESLDQF